MTAAGPLAIARVDGFASPAGNHAAWSAADRAPGLAGASIELPSASRLPFPWLEIIGWGLGQEGPIERVELLHRGQLCRRVPVDLPRADVAEAFPGVAWAAKAGFATRVSLVGTGGAVELEVRVVLANGESVCIGRIAGTAAQPPAAPVMIVLDAGEATADARFAALAQNSAATGVLIRGADEPAGHPGWRVTPNWNHVLDYGDALVWLSDGADDVTEGFLAQGVSTLMQRPDASFVVAVENAAQPPAPELIGALSGTRLGCTILFRTSAIRTVGGIDEGAKNAVTAQWDLAVRLAEAGHRSLELVACKPGAATLAERGGPDTGRWLYRKHAQLYQRHMREVLFDREAVRQRLLRVNDLKERELAEDLRPRLRARRRERDRLTAKLRPTAGARTRRADGLRHWGDLRRLEPVSPNCGSERGLRIDRYYVGRFLQRHAGDIGGIVLENHDSAYARRYGAERLQRCDTLDLDPTNAQATFVADLRHAPEVPSEGYDCVILAHVLSFLDDPAAALAECRRILRPGGVLLTSVPAAGRVDPERPDADHWRFSQAGLRRLVDQAFRPGSVEVRAEGNRSAVIAFMVGLATEELGPTALGQSDPSAPLVITARAVRPKPGTDR